LKPAGRGVRATFSGVLGGGGLVPGLRRLTSVSLYRNASFLVASSVVTTSLGFFFWITVARLYSTTEVGLGSAIISTVNFIALFSAIGLNFSIIRFFSRTDDRREMVNSAFTLTGLVALAVAVVVVFAAGPWSPALDIVRSRTIFIITFLALAVLSTWSTLINSVFIGGRRAIFALGKDGILALLKIGLVGAFASFLHTFGVVASWTVALGIALSLSALLFLPRVMHGYRPVPELNMSRIRSLWRYAAGNYTASLLTRGPILILPIVVVSLLGTESNAYFYVAWAISNVLGSVTLSVSQSLFAEGSHAPENIRQDVTRSILFTLVVMVPAVIVLLAAGKWVLLAFGSDYSTNSLGLLMLLAAAALPRGAVHVYSGLLRAQDRLKELIALRSFIAITILVVSSLLMPRYGIISVGYVWLGVFLLASLAIAPRLAGQSSRFGRPREGEWEDVDPV